MGYYSGLMGIYGDLMGFYSGLMGIYGDLMGFYSDLLGFIVIQWDLNGIYPLVNVYITMQHHHVSHR